MSLVAALAVAGFTSSASAVDLTEAIKNVDISGQFRYRYDIHNTEGGVEQSDSDVNIDVLVKVPVNDNVTAVFNINNDNDDAQDTDAFNGGDVADAAVTLDEYYFQYVNGGLTVNAGHQVIPGRIVDGPTGQGLVALYNFGVATVGAAYFTNHSYDTLAASTAWQANGLATRGGTEDIASVIAMGSVGPVSFLGQYNSVADLADSYNLKADAKVGPVAFGVEYTDTEYESDAVSALLGNGLGKKDDNSTLKVYVSGSIDIVSAKLTYAKTGDNGGGSFAVENEAASEYLMWQLDTAGEADFDLWALDVSAKVTDSITLRAAYADGESAGDVDQTEALGQVSYQMSKNLNTYIRYTNYERGTSERDMGRVEIKYTF